MPGGSGEHPANAAITGPVASLTITGLTASRLVQTNASKTLASVADLTSWVAGTANQVTVADDGDGTLTLSLPTVVNIGPSEATGFADARLSLFSSTDCTFVMRETVNDVTGKINVSATEVQVGSETNHGLALHVFGSDVLSFSTANVATFTAAVQPEANNTRDLGASGTTWRNIYAGTQFLGADGTAANPSFAFGSAVAKGMYLVGAAVAFSNASEDQFAYFDGALTMRSDVYFGWTSGASTATSDLRLYRDAANVLAQRNGANAQTVYVYGTFTDASNYERIHIKTAAGARSEIWSTANGTGTVRDLAVGKSTAFWTFRTSSFQPSADNSLDIAESGQRARTGYFGTALAVGTNPAASGAIRLANNVNINWRNAANSADIPVLFVNAFDNINLGTTATGAGVAIAESTGSLGFFNTSPASQRLGGVTLTNNITSGGTTNQLDNWTDLSTYATDAAAIRNACYQLGRKLKLVTDALRTYGLLQNADA